METAKIVNLAFEGQPEHPALQVMNTLKIFEFSQILNENISNGDLSHPTIQRILSQGHIVNITFDENDNVSLHF